MSLLSRRARPAGLAALLVGLAVFAPHPALASDPCNPPNVLPQPVCDFDNWHGSSPREVADGWAEFILAGNPDFYRDEHSFFGGGTQTIRSGDPFKAGIWTQVQVTPGAGYRASIAWGAPNLPAEFGRQLGLDPTGGTDPGAATVIWGPVHFGDGRILNYPVGEGPNIDVRARAVGDHMTLFFFVDRPSTSGDGLIFIDAIALYPDESAPPPTGEPPTEAMTSTWTPESPTDTPVPDTPTPETPTATPVAQVFIPTVETSESAPALAAAAAPVPEPATALLLPPDTPTPAPLPSEAPTLPPTPTATASPTPTATPSPTQTPTATPTWTPWPTAVPPSLLSARGGTVLLHSFDRSTAPPALVAVSALGFLGAALFGGSLVWLRRRR
jgi:hypothetical protein